MKKTSLLFPLLLLLFTATRSVSARFVYVTSSDSQTLSAYSIEKNGSLILVPGSSIQIPIQPNCLAVDRAGRFLFAAATRYGQPHGDVYVYLISNTGLLKPVTGSPFSVALNPTGLATDLKDNLLFVLGLDAFDDDHIASYSVDGNGKLRSTPNSLFTSPYISAAMGMDPTGRFLYITSDEFEGVGAYQIDSTGRLSPVPGQPFDQGDEQLDCIAFGPKSVYVGRGAENLIVEFGIGETGALTYLPGVVAGTLPPRVPSTGSNACPLALASDSSHRFLYATTADTVEGFVIQVNNNVCGFTIGSTGELTQFPNFAVNNIDNPAQIVADPKSNYLYITSATGVHGYAVQRDGTLQEVFGSPFPIQVEPGGLIVQ